MTPDQYQRVRELFHRAAELAGAERSKFLDEACDGDDALKAEVESLLAHEITAGDADVFDESRLGFGRALVENEANADAARRHPTRIGAYRLLELIGEGGMGVVYKAEQESPRRVVALKIVRRLSSGSALRRFESEAQLLGELRHPGIAEVFEAAVHDDGVEKLPYFVMELIPDALPLTKFAERAELNLRDRLTLFASACDAVQHGHQHGVIHRDLKPDNILVDDAGRPKVIDFGVARVIRLDAEAVTATRTGQIIGTLAYMSPEQLAGDVRDIDTRADVYALGVVLYELLAGELPLDVSDTSIPEACRIIREVDPALLSVKRPELRGDIEQIAAKAMEKDKERRYASAGELAADIRRLLNDEPVLARPPTVMYQLRKFARRNRGLVTGVAAAAVFLVVGFAVAVTLAITATRARNAAMLETYRASITAAASALEKHDVALARRSLAMAPEALREWEWYHLLGRLDESLLSISSPYALSGALPWIVGTDAQPAVLLRTKNGLATWSMRTGKPQGIRAAPGAVYAADHKGRADVVLVGDELRIRRSDGSSTHDAAALRAAVGEITRIAISEGGRFIAVAAPEAVARLDLDTETVSTVPVHNLGTGVDALAVTIDGRVAIASALGGRPALWIPGEPLTELEDVSGFARSVDVSPDGRKIVLGLQNTTVGLWRASDRALLALGRGHEHAVTGVAFSPNGERIASVSIDRTVRIWNAAPLDPFSVLHGHDRGIWGVAFSHDGSQVVTTGEDRTIRIWDATRRDGRDVLLGHDGFVLCVAFSMDGRRLASAGWDHTIRIWNTSTSEEIERFPVDANVVTAVSFSSDGRFLAWVGSERIGAWDLHDRSEVTPDPAYVRPSNVTVKNFDFVDDASIVPLPWTLSPKGIMAWNVGDNTLESWTLGELAKHRSGFLTSDGRFAVGVLGEGGTAADVRRAWSDSGSALLVLDTAQAAPARLPAFSGPFELGAWNDHTAVLAARPVGDLTRVEIWDIGRGRLLGELVGHTDSVYAIAYSPDGQRIATAGRDSLRLWDARTFGEIVQLRGHTSFIWSLAFSPDGSQLASASGDGTVRLWSARARASTP